MFFLRDKKYKMPKKQTRQKRQLVPASVKQAYEETNADIRLPYKYPSLLHLQDNLHLAEKFAIDLKYNVANRSQQYPENNAINRQTSTAVFSTVNCLEKKYLEIYY